MRGMRSWRSSHGALPDGQFRPAMAPRLAAAEIPRSQSLRLRSLIALAMTLTDESAIAAAAMIGDTRMPNTG